MPVTQYIGSRYVPVFADPIEWSSTKTYEPLTIVLHEGNSYTSKQYVPIGVDINNDKFWAKTGNYNAQVEQYRRDVANYATTVNQLSGDVQGLSGDVQGLSGDVQGLSGDVQGLNDTKNYKILICPDDFNGQDDTSKIIAALNYAKEHNVGIGFKCRQYIVNESLPLYRNARIYGNGATLIVNDSFSLFKTQDDYSSNAIIADFFIVGPENNRNEESICIDFEGYSCSFTNLDIRNFYWAIYQRNDLTAKSNQVGNFYINLKVRNCNNSFYFGANDNNRNTDGYMNNIIACGNHQLFIGSAAGWLIENFHSFGAVQGDNRTVAPITLHACGATELNNIYVESASWSEYNSSNCMISAHVAKDCSINNAKIIISDTCACAVRFSSTATARNQTLNISNLFADNPSRNSENTFSVLLLEHRLNRNVYISNVNSNIPNGTMTSEADKNYLSVLKYGGFASIDNNAVSIFDNVIPNVLKETKSAAGNIEFNIPAKLYSMRNFIVFGNARHLAQSDSPITRCFVVGSFYHTTSRQDFVFNPVSSDNITVTGEYDADTQTITIKLAFTSDDANQRGQFSCMWC